MGNSIALILASFGIALSASLAHADIVCDSTDLTDGVAIIDCYGPDWQPITCTVEEVGSLTFVECD